MFNLRLRGKRGHTFSIGLKWQFIICFQGPNSVCRTLCVFLDHEILENYDIIVTLCYYDVRPIPINRTLHF